MATWITVCETCRAPGASAVTSGRAGPDGPAGADLAARVEAAAGGTALRVRRVACLMGCDGGCNVAVQAPGKIAYALGRFELGAEAAEGIVAWALLHAESATGQVPYRLWPTAVKGHFVARQPPLPEGA